MKPALSGKNVVVFGLAKSGLSAIRLLEREGARVTAVDEKLRVDLGPLASELEGRGVRLALGQVRAETLRSADLVVVSPGVPLAQPAIVEARQAGVPVWGEVELASRFLGPGPVIGITGTNGKSTTTALCGHIFSQAMPAFVGGNLGLPLSEAPAGAYQAYVVELSSFQLEGIDSMRLNGAAILNLTPDHIDRYPSHDAYGEAKARIFRNQRFGDFAVINADDAHVVRLARQAKVDVFGFSSSGRAAAHDGTNVAALATPADGGFTFRGQSFRVNNRALRGAHNLENAMAAALLARLAGVDAPAVQQGLDTYPGLPHRLEYVRAVEGVEWINDSKATNVDSSLVALRAFPGGIWLIAGGKGKGAPYAPLVEASRGKVKGVLTIGDDAETIAAAYRGAHLEVVACGTLERAVQQARTRAVAGDTVLLSPACASYDQFKNFEDRGDTFKRLVRAL